MTLPSLATFMTRARGVAPADTLTPVRAGGASASPARAEREPGRGMEPADDRADRDRAAASWRDGRGGGALPRRARPPGAVGFGGPRPADGSPRARIGAPPPPRCGPRRPPGGPQLLRLPPPRGRRPRPPPG